MADLIGTTQLNSSRCNHLLKSINPGHVYASYVLQRLSE